MFLLSLFLSPDSPSFLRPSAFLTSMQSAEVYAMLSAINAGKQIAAWYARRVSNRDERAIADVREKDSSAKAMKRESHTRPRAHERGDALS